MAAGDHQSFCEEEDPVLRELPRIHWRPNDILYQINGFWHTSQVVKAVMAMQSDFKPLPSDILIASFPKTGTTWLKALTLSIINHNSSSPSSDPLLTHNPHELIPLLELESFGENPKNNIQDIASPRILSTHLNLLNLPDSVMSSGCRVIYIARNPMDTLVSYWHFFNKLLDLSVPLEVVYEEFCSGTVPAGPYFDHVLEYWKEKDKENLLFLTYEELKEDPEKHVKRLADFLGCPLNPTEVKEIVKNSSYQRLRDLNVNQNRSEKVHWSGVGFGSFFRQGVVGDWKNHLSPEMVRRLDQIASQKFEGSGLELKSTVGSS